MERVLNIGIIGAGGIAHCHSQGYKSCSNVKMTCVCDIDLDKAKAFANEFGIARVYESFEEMIEKEELDGVSVCTWNAAHKAPTIAALNAGINVICEKPMAMNRFEAAEMLEAQKKSGKLLQIGFVRRFGNDAAILKTFIDNGTLGDIYYAKATYLRRNGCPGRWFGDKEYSGGGPLIDLGVHVMDLVRYLCGNPKPVSAYGFTYDNLGYNRASGGQTWMASNSNAVKEFNYNVEDFVGAIIRFDNGLTLNVEASFNLNIKNDVGNIELFGTKSGAKIDPQIEFFTDMNGMLVDIKPSGDSSLSFNGLFENEIKHFVDCIVNKTKCRAEGEDGVVLMKMIDAIYESANTGKVVNID